MDSEDRCSESITMAVVTALADARGVDPAELDVVLNDHVDLDALESLAEHGGSWTFTFEVSNHTVTVTNERVAVVDGAVDRIRA